MKFCAFLLLLALWPLGASAIDRDVTRTLAVKPDSKLRVDFARGGIDVQETDAAEISVTMHLMFAGMTELQADRLQAALGIEIKQEGETVIVRAASAEGRGVKLSWDDNSPVDLDCKILVPRRCDVDLQTREGGITVGNLVGRVVARVGKGSLFIRRIDGTVDASVQTGDVILSRCSGSVVAKTERGVMRIGTLGGRAVLRNTGGDIEVLQATAGLDVDAEVGDVTVGLPHDFAGETKIRTAYGSIFAKIDPRANCAVEASSFWGHVDNKLPLAVVFGGDGKGKLAGRLNRGGPLVILHANGGHVFLKSGDTYFN